MTQLGYDKHRIIALDQDTFTHFKNLNAGLDGENQKYRIFLPHHNNSDTLDAYFPDPKSVKFLLAGGESGKQHRAMRKKIWNIRLKCINAYIQDDYNLMLSDADSLWLKYFDLNKLPNTFDGFYGWEREAWPTDVFEKWGLVLHAREFAMFSNPRTKNLWKTVIEECQNDCDDQYIINRVLSNLYQIEKFYEMPGSNHLYFGQGKNYVKSRNQSNHDIQHVRALFLLFI